MDQESPKANQFPQISYEDAVRFFKEVVPEGKCPMCGNTSWRVPLMDTEVDSIEKHSATKADLATTELNLIKWYVGTAFAMTGLASAITFGLTKLLSH